MPFDNNSPICTDETLGTLIAVDTLLSDESKWCQGSAMKDDRVCIMGAAAIAFGAPPSQLVGKGDYPSADVAWRLFKLDEYLSNAFGLEAVSTFNDSHSFNEVKELLAKSIARRTAELLK